MSERMEAEYSLEVEFHTEMRNQLALHARLKQTNTRQEDLTVIYTELHNSLMNLKKNDFAIIGLRNNQCFCLVFLKTVEQLVKTKSFDEHIMKAALNTFAYFLRRFFSVNEADDVFGEGPLSEGWRKTLYKDFFAKINTNLARYLGGKLEHSSDTPSVDINNNTTTTATATSSSSTVKNTPTLANASSFADAEFNCTLLEVLGWTLDTTSFPKLIDKRYISLYLRFLVQNVAQLYPKKMLHIVNKCAFQMGEAIMGGNLNDTDIDRDYPELLEQLADALFLVDDEWRTRCDAKLADKLVDCYHSVAITLDYAMESLVLRDGPRLIGLVLERHVGLMANAVRMMGQGSSVWSCKALNTSFEALSTLLGIETFKEPGACAHIYDELCRLAIGLLNKRKSKPFAHRTFPQLTVNAISLIGELLGPKTITLNLFFYKYWSSLEATWIEMFLNERHNNGSPNIISYFLENYDSEQSKRLDFFLAKLKEFLIAEETRGDDMLSTSWTSEMMVQLIDFYDTKLKASKERVDSELLPLIHLELKALRTKKMHCFFLSFDSFYWLLFRQRNRSKHYFSRTDFWSPHIDSLIAYLDCDILSESTLTKTFFHSTCELIKGIVWYSSGRLKREQQKRLTNFLLALKLHCESFTDIIEIEKTIDAIDCGHLA